MDCLAYHLKHKSVWLAGPQRDHSFLHLPIGYKRAHAFVEFRAPAHCREAISLSQVLEAWLINQLCIYMLETSKRNLLTFSNPAISVQAMYL